MWSACRASLYQFVEFMWTMVSDIAVKK